MSPKGVVIKKRTALLIALVTLARGLIGTSLSTLYTQYEYSGNIIHGMVKESYGFPLGWYGYLRITGETGIPLHNEIYWFSLESLILDAAFWFAISFFAGIATLKSVRMLRKIEVSKILSVINMVVMYFFASLSFLVVGLCLSSVTQTLYIPYGPPGISVLVPFKVVHPYEDLGLRLFGFGIFLVAATFYQTLLRERKPLRNIFSKSDMGPFWQNCIRALITDFLQGSYGPVFTADFTEPKSELFIGPVLAKPH